MTHFEETPKILFIRNREEFDNPESGISEKETRAWFNEHIFKYLVHPFFSNPFEVIHKTSEEDLFNSDDEIKTDLSHVKVVIILTELKWRGNRFSDYYGFNIVKKLREQKVKQPIIICSFHSKDAFLRTENPSYEILHTPCHTLIQLPINQKIHLPKEAMWFLTEHLLSQIMLYKLNVRGSIHEIFHNLKNAVRGVYKSAQEEEIRKGFNRLKRLLKSIEQEKLRIIEEKGIKELPEIKDRDTFLSSLTLEVLQLLPQEESADAEGLEEVKGWGVLFIDDEKQTLKLLQKLFVKEKITCFIAKSGEEAFEILEKDGKGNLIGKEEKPFPPNFITVIISDMRFQTGDDWHYWQGVDIINYIHNKLKNLAFFFMLTSKQGAISKEAEKDQATNISWHYKGNVLNKQAGFNVFAELIRKKGGDQYQALCSRPSGRYWREVWTGNIAYPMWEYYRYHRLSSNYHQVEDLINEDAMSLIEYAEEYKSYLSSNPDQRVFYPELNFPQRLKSKLEREPGDSDTMGKFFAKLAARRAILSLRCLGWESEKIRLALIYHTLNPTEEELQKGRKSTDDSKEDKHFYPAHLGMSTKIEKDIPNKILVEERLFLEQRGYAVEYDTRRFYQEVENIFIAFRSKIGADSRKKAGLSSKPNIQDLERLKYLVIRSLTLKKKEPIAFKELYKLRPLFETTAMIRENGLWELVVGLDEG